MFAISFQSLPTKPAPHSKAHANAVASDPKKGQLNPVHPSSPAFSSPSLDPTTPKAVPTSGQSSIHSVYGVRPASPASLMSVLDLTGVGGGGAPLTLVPTRMSDCSSIGSISTLELPSALSTPSQRRLFSRRNSDAMSTFSRLSASDLAAIASPSSALNLGGVPFERYGTRSSTSSGRSTRSRMSQAEERRLPPGRRAVLHSKLSTLLRHG